MVAAKQGTTWWQQKGKKRQGGWVKTGEERARWVARGLYERGEALSKAGGRHHLPWQLQLCRLRSAIERHSGCSPMTMCERRSNPHPAVANTSQLRCLVPNRHHQRDAHAWCDSKANCEGEVSPVVTAYTCAMNCTKASATLLNLTSGSTGWVAPTAAQPHIKALVPCGKRLAAQQHSGTAGERTSSARVPVQHVKHSVACSHHIAVQDSPSTE